jgi:hypothetical protein
MARLTGAALRVDSLYQQLAAEEERFAAEVAEGRRNNVWRIVGPGAAGQIRKHEILLAQFRNNYPAELNALRLPPDARPPGRSQGPVAVWPSGHVGRTKRGRKNIDEFWYECGETDDFGTPAEYAEYLFRRYYDL